MTTLTDEQIQQRLAGLDGWERSGAAISKTFRFADFPAAVAFITRMVEPAERANHHPDVDLRYNQVVVALTTHSEGGLTDRDFALAETIDTLA